MGQVSLDGVAGAGKSTLSKLLRSQLPDAHIVEDRKSVYGYARLMEMLKPDAFAITDGFIRYQTDNYTQQGNIFERSFITQLPYIIAYKNLTASEAHRLIDHYQKSIDSGQLIIPDLIVYIAVDAKTAFDRQKQMNALINKEGDGEKTLRAEVCYLCALLQCISNVKIITISGEDVASVLANKKIMVEIDRTLSASPNNNKSLDLDKFKSLISDLLPE